MGSISPLFWVRTRSWRSQGHSQPLRRAVGAPRLSRERSPTYAEEIRSAEGGFRLHDFAQPGMDLTQRVSVFWFLGVGGWGCVGVFWGIQFGEVSGDNLRFVTQTRRNACVAPSRPDYFCDPSCLKGPPVRPRPTI